MIPDHSVRCRIHLSSSPARVFAFLATNEGRCAFWADSAGEQDGVIHFRFSNGMAHFGRILSHNPPHEFAIEYFGGSRASFSLEPDEKGGTDLTLTETDIPAEWFPDQRAGWITVLLSLKAAVDFGIDLRNPDPGRTWEKGYVDV